MDNEQGNQDDAVYENTLLEHYDHVRIDQEVIEAELQGREEFQQRPVPEYYRRPVKRITPEPPRPDTGSKIMTLVTPHLRIFLLFSIRVSSRDFAAENVYICLLFAG